MKVKTSITLSPEVLRELDQVAGAVASRSRIIERALREFLERKRREAREAKDLEILNRSADSLNREVEDVVTYQVFP